MNNSDDPWDIRHLGVSYFKNIGRFTVNKYSLVVPIKLVYVGKTGETYNTPNVNPNWSAEMIDGNIVRFHSTKKKVIGTDHWTSNNCFIFKWDYIKDVFKGIS